MSGKDITEGRANRAIAVEIGNKQATTWQNTGVDYDVAVGGVPFLLNATDAHPYERMTAPFRKNQFDTQRDPGEQSITGWWMRSQSSFHSGCGVDYYDPFANPFSTTLASNSYRYDKSLGVNPWSVGKVTLLPVCNNITATAAAKHLDSANIGGVDYLLMLDTNIYLVDSAGAKTTLVTAVGTINAFTTDGTSVYFLDGTTIKSILLTGGSIATLYTVPATVNGAAMHWVKQRLVVGIDAALYELPTVATGATSVFSIAFTQQQAVTDVATLTTTVPHSMQVGDHITVSAVGTNGTTYNGAYYVSNVTPTSIEVFNTGANLAYAANTGTITINSNYPVYTHPNPAWVWVDIDEGGPAIYASGYAGSTSTIFMFVLTNNGTMPVLTAGIVAAQFPAGEIIYSVYGHLGTYLVVGTNQGVRVAQIDQATGYISYGPILVQTATPVRGFASRGSYVWFGSSVYDQFGNSFAGTWRIDLSVEIDVLRFAVAQDVYATSTLGTSYDIAFLGNSNRVAFLASTSAGTPSSLGLWLQDASVLVNSGFIQTGLIRYNTLEPKNFKRIVGRGDYGVKPSDINPSGTTKGSMTISTIDTKGNVYDIVSYGNNVGTPESTITDPVGAQDALAFRFTLYRDAVTTSLSPTFTGYQVKSVPASPRQRIIKIPLLCYDVDTDKYNATLGYEGFAWDRLSALENIEANGDVVTFQDFRNNETTQCLIEELSFIGKVSPDKRLTNFGGSVMLTIRTV